MANPFSLDAYTAIPRVNGMLLSPDGGRLVLQVQTLAPDGARFVTSLWGMPADGSAPARRLTFSEKGESSPAFLPDGSLVFASARPDPSAKADEADGRLWCLPAGGGEARCLLAVPGGVESVVTAQRAPRVVIRAALFDGAGDLAADADRAKRRKELGTSAILFEAYPIRHWDHDLGPRRSRLLGLTVTDDGATPEDLTGEAGVALNEAQVALSPDGGTVVSTWWRHTGQAFYDSDLVAISGGGRRTLAGGEDFGAPAISPDGRQAVALRRRQGRPDRAPDTTLWLIDLAGGEGRDLTPDLDLWPDAPVWSADGRAVYFTADEGGRAPVFRLELASGEPLRLTDEGGFSSLCPAPDGVTLYALRSSYCSPPEIVRIDADGTVTPLPTPGLPLDLPGRIAEVTATADDGQALRAWLVLPADASDERPAPLALFVHGGPLGSWNRWSWRWCPHLLVERGYAVLLPDPALSTGYGWEFVQRAWGSWGRRAFTDLMAITDAALARPDLDATRTAAMGGSFGGYMANWIAGHTDRFRAIVSHAGLWALDQFRGTTDMGTRWELQFGDLYTDPSRYEENSPNRHVGSIRTPMLVIHGLRDYRVPIGEAQRLWIDLQRHGVPSQYLFFPDENHWILNPGNIRTWYETILAFLDHHVLGRDYRRPDML